MTLRRALRAVVELAARRIGGGAGSAEDRIPPALQLAQHGKLDYLVFECLAERTIAREQLSKTKDPEAGYTPSMEERVRTVLPACVANKVRIVSNMGAANPPAAARAAAPSSSALAIDCAASAARPSTSDFEAVCIGCGISTIGSAAKPRPAACTRAAPANAVLQMVAVGMPWASSLTPSATLMEAEVPQSP